MNRVFLGSIFFILLLIVSCTFTKKIKTGEQAYDVKQYSIAIQMLTEEYKNTNYLNDKARKAFLIGNSYERMNEPEGAIQWYKLASEHNFGNPATEKYAESLKKNQQYPEAIKVYQDLLKNNSTTLLYRQQITICQLAQEWLSKKAKSPYKLRSLDFNTPAADYAPFVMGPDLVAFTSDRTASTGDDLYTWTGNHFSDLFVVNTSSNVVESFDPTINTENNEGTIVLNRDRTEMYFTRCFSEETYDAYCQIMVSNRRGQGWSDPEPLPFVKEGINYWHPVLAESDSLMFLSSNDPDGSGGYDIYYVERTAEGWGELNPLGSRVNSEGNENFPSLHKDTLYFSSDRHPGMGGLDIFKTWIGQDGNWIPPQNLKPPINSGWDDFSFVVDTFARLRGAEMMKGYFSSSRNTGQGSDDIFAFTKMGDVPDIDDPIESEDPTVDTKTYKIFLALKVVEPILSDPSNPNSERTGFNPLKFADISASDGPMATALKTDAQGYLIMELEYGKKYSFGARYKDHFRNSLRLDTKGIEKDPNETTKTINRQLVLEPIIKNVEIVLDNIYYDTDESFIRDDAKPILDSLARILIINPQIKIELGSHTDCRAEDIYNARLSQRRAQSAVTYLSQKGVNARRLSARGYGENNLAVNCKCEDCTEDQHQANRRTTFKIVD